MKVTSPALLLKATAAIVACVHLNGAVASSQQQLSDDVLAIIGNKITFNGKPLQLGGGLVKWKDVLGGQPICTPERKGFVFCTWHELGIEVGTGGTMLNVTFFNIHLQDATVPLYMAGLPVDREWYPGPRSRFKGKFAIDTALVDGSVPFRDILPKLDSSRGVRCGLVDCTVASGRLDEYSAIYFELDGRRSSDTILEVGLSRITPVK